MTDSCSNSDLHLLCRSDDLIEQGLAVPFDVVYAGQRSRGFAVRFGGGVHAYLNRCTHVPMELDWQPNQVFDITGRWLLCATHGAHFKPDTGACAGGPCRGGLVKVALCERDNQVWWQASSVIQPVVLPVAGDGLANVSET